MLKLIVHADDFGLSERINEGIRQAHLNGILTSASLMASGPAFEQAVGICRTVPTLDVGVHLTLVGERPVLDPQTVPTLVDERGLFPRHATVFARQYFRNKFSLPEIRAELEAQIKKVLSHGISISHLDSHQHVHMLPQLLAITVDLARQYRIPCVRFPHETVRSFMWGGPAAFSRVAQLLGLRFFCYLGRRASIARANHFAGFFHGGKLNRENLKRVLEHLPLTGTCELMCHPGLDDPATPYGHWHYCWADELSSLTDPESADFLRRRGIKLISYRELPSLNP
jgi:hopanoid biosynthesis associated protein HpnK